MEDHKPDALERFIEKTRTLFAAESDMDKRWTALTPILAEMLADPDVLEAAKGWPDCVPRDGRAENLLFYEDADFGFAINGLTKGTARDGVRARIHDHAHIYTLYGVLDGHEQIERYDRLDDRSKPDYAEIRLASDKHVGPGEIDLVRPYEVHTENTVAKEPWPSSSAARRAAASTRAATNPRPTNTTRAWGRVRRRWTCCLVPAVST